MTDPLLKTVGLSMRFGGVAALTEVSIEVRRGEILGLIGPNGSGKSTWLNCVSGLLRPTAGRVYLRDIEVTARTPHKLFQLAVGRTFQLLENFPDMTVRENLLLAAQERRGSVVTRLFRFSEPEETLRMNEMLQLFKLGHVAELPVKHLSYGQQKLCDLAMALMADPELLLLDEPMAGVNPVLIEQIADDIRQLALDGKTFIIVEHNMKAMMELCSRMVVLSSGVKIAEGRPADIRSNKDVVKAYFGR